MTKINILICLILCSVLSSTLVFAGVSERKKLTIKLTKEMCDIDKQVGGDGVAIVVFSVDVKDNKTLRIVQKNSTQQDPLSDGQLTSVLAAYMPPKTVDRLKNFGFKKGVFIDGRSRKYPFQISEKYYHSFMRAMGK